MPGRGEPWEDLEFRLLFSTFPLSGRSPQGPELDEVARRLDRSKEAVRQQWDDARTYCLGRKGVSAGPVQSYVDQQGLCRDARA